MNRDEPTSSPDEADPLDDWLPAARWPQPSAESTARLRQTWHRFSTPRPWRLLAPLSAAAVVALAIGIAWVSMRKPPVNRSEMAANSQTVPPRPALVAGRPPTVLETMMIRAAEDREKRARTAAIKRAGDSPPLALHKPIPRPASVPPALPVPPAPTSIAATPPPPPRSKASAGEIVNLLERSDEAAMQRYLDLLADHATRADALAALAKVPSPPTERMLAAFNDPHVDRRLGAALALGRIDGPVLTHRLIDMVAADQHRREAFIALASSRGAEARAFVRQATNSQSLAPLARSTLAMNELHQNEVQ